MVQKQQVNSNHLTSSCIYRSKIQRTEIVIFENPVPWFSKKEIVGVKIRHVPLLLSQQTASILLFFLSASLLLPCFFFLCSSYSYLFFFTSCLQTLWSRIIILSIQLISSLLGSFQIWLSWTRADDSGTQESNGKKTTQNPSQHVLLPSILNGVWLSIKQVSPVIRLEENEESVPPWLIPLLKTSYFDHCKIHLNASKCECNMYCLDCMDDHALCSYCLLGHRDHHIVQVNTIIHSTWFCFFKQRRNRGLKLNIYVLIPLDLIWFDLIPSD